MAIIDIFSFCGEMDVLEIRLNILYDYVDEFIICESNETFTGLKKPLYFKENMTRYEKFLPKIKHFVMASNDPILLLGAKKSPGVPKNLHWWKREYTQKESMRYALTHLEDDDLVFIGDVDEIWNPLNMPPFGRWKLRQNVYSYYLNNRSNEWWEGTSVIPYQIIKSDTLDNLRAHDTHRGYMKAPTYPNWGWHFTNIGGAEFIKRKLSSYSHQEFNSPKYTDKIEQRIAENKDFIGRNFNFWIDESELPKYILENKEKYKNLFKEGISTPAPEKSLLENTEVGSISFFVKFYKIIKKTLR